MTDTRTTIDVEIELRAVDAEIEAASARRRELWAELQHLELAAEAEQVLEAPADPAVLASWSHDPTAFAALALAETYVAEMGWSIGTLCGSSPRGVIFAEGVSIPKWRNVHSGRDDFDAYLVTTDRFRYGPIVLTTERPAS